MYALQLPYVQYRPPQRQYPYDKKSNLILSRNELIPEGQPWSLQDNKELSTLAIGIAPLVGHYYLLLSVCAASSGVSA